MNLLNKHSLLIYQQRNGACFVFVKQGFRGGGRKTALKELGYFYAQDYHGRSQRQKGGREHSATTTLKNRMNGKRRHSRETQSTASHTMHGKLLNILRYYRIRRLWSKVDT